ncbi:MAG: 2-oxo acid dehydrogenase subunit E2 [Oligoflexia bacterium]|nr:2-oxo acid dehydrogenase subunit E2 [Oligoflexia bacterium]
MSDFIDVLMPTGQQEGTQSVVARWLKKVGEQVKAHEPLIEISTDKVVMEVSSPESGVLMEILQGENQSVQPGMLLGRIKRGDATDVSMPAALKANAPNSSSQQAASVDSSQELSPAVKRLLQQHGLSASAVKGSGRGGRITVEDVERTVASGVKPQLSGRRVPHDHMRRAIAQHMLDSVTTAPHVTTVFEANLSKVLAHKEKHALVLEKRGIKLSLTAYFVKAAAEALSAFPQVNSRWHDDAVEILDEVNVGIATALDDKGLIVPVVKGAQKLSLDEIAEKLQALVQKARVGKLDTADVQDGTFTISNHGVSGSLFAAPIIINQPQAAILGIGKLERRVRAVQAKNGYEFKVEPMMYVTLTIDHRSLDGFVANSFLAKFVSVLESWE